MDCHWIPALDYSPDDIRVLIRCLPISLFLNGAFLLALIFGYGVMMLWNWLMPELFGLVAIDFWKAVGIIILARLIFGGFKHSDPHSKWKDRREKRDDKTSFSKWKYYEDFREAEGKDAFRRYVDRKRGEDESINTEQ